MDYDSGDTLNKMLFILNIVLGTKYSLSTLHFCANMSTIFYWKFMGGHDSGYLYNPRSRIRIMKWNNSDIQLIMYNSGIFTERH